MMKVGCAGILVADTFCGPMDALPEEGHLLAVAAMPTHPGGCAANTAIGLAKQGIDVDVVGCVGNDTAAEVLLGGFRKHGVGFDHIVRVDEYPTSQTVILLVKGQDRRYIHMFGANGAFEVKHISRDWLASLDVFCLGGLFGMPRLNPAELLSLLKFCREKNVTTLVDVIVPQQQKDLSSFQFLLPYIDYFLPNDDEAARITGQTAPVAQARALRDGGVGTVIVTRGSRGVLAADAEGMWRCGVYEVNGVDPSGCGDAFTAGVIVSILRGADMPATLRYATALGASAMRAVGTTGGLFTGTQAAQFIETHPLNVEYFKA